MARYVIAVVEAGPDSFGAIVDGVSKGGVVVLLAWILIVLVRKAPALVDQITKSHELAIDKVAQTFAADAREARSIFRQEQESARASWAAVVRDERTACEARMARLEQKIDAHREGFGDLAECLTKLATLIEAKDR